MGASKVLQTSQSTVVRRIAGLEAHLGFPLFERRASGYIPTEHLQALLPAIEAVAKATQTFETLVDTRQRSLTGTLRFTAPEVLISYVLPQVLARFRETYPAVGLELIGTDRAVDLAEGEADVALRAGSIPAVSDLFGRRLAYDRIAVVASRDYASRHGLPGSVEDLARHQVIWASYVPPRHPLALWVKTAVPSSAIALRPDTAVATFAAIRAGLGLGFFHSFFVDRDPELVRAPMELPLEPNELWILAHERSRQSAPVRQFMAFVSAYVLGSSPANARSA
ncbi:DNA-binding transcriptional LysR family regulator [Aureimonas phyllosphaerae]|uniref:DNA-binding transcriptional LysR family regulator n=1 Tax=Aureimonas phyllosphaerae TaxID=1166078 RepID=A0A7W6BUP1_9HYPH|nr:DNA-binding transcriptional LysR family regulator [Aureimonas phyllosphaerae]MBB3962337.1 DNA-binding transcriptional LysR family regulator [Aureimonas phyllosphaerae]